jgi:mRNA interferase RelE/StbE
VQERIGDAVRLLAHSPFAPQLGVKKLRGTHDLYRMRVGDYRILYEVRSEIVTIVVIKIGHRREVYRR